MSELRELGQLREENRKLKGLVADPSLDKAILHEALRKTVGEQVVPMSSPMGLKDKRSSTEERLRVVYYPFSRCVDATSLKRLVLLFDEVWFVEPLAEDIIELPSVFRWEKKPTKMLKRFPLGGQGPALSIDGLENAILWDKCIVTAI